MTFGARIGGALWLLAAAVADAQTTVPEKAADESATPAAEPEEQRRLQFRVDPDRYSIVSQARGLSTHRPSYVYPLSYSPDFHGKQSEMVFQLSAKQRLFDIDLYLAYTQKSFWQFLNQDESSPFRETNYAPELFYRWIPRDPEPLNHWGADFGLEHESNGREFPFSRSWNRLYFAPFQAKGNHLAYIKLWYRIPEGRASAPENPKGDDNPDIHRYLGYSELSYSRQIAGKQLLTAMARGNLETGKGALSFTWSVPSSEGYVFYAASVFHGYGESLSLYNESITRVMLGVMLAR